MNADGTPKVMYHGSRARFTIFDKSKAKSSGLYGKGFYFTDSSSNAGLYGEQYSVYLNIRNPLQPDGSTASRDQVRRFIEAIARATIILYDVNNIRNIDRIKKASPAAQMSSTDLGGTRTTLRDASDDMLSHEAVKVKPRSAIFALRQM